MTRETRDPARPRGTADERSSTRDLIAEHRQLSTAEGTLQWELDQLIEILRQRGTIDALAYVAEVEGEEEAHPRRRT